MRTSAVRIPRRPRRNEQKYTDSTALPTTDGTDISNAWYGGIRGPARRSASLRRSQKLGHHRESEPRRPK